MRRAVVQSGTCEMNGMFTLMDEPDATPDLPMPSEVTVLGTDVPAVSEDVVTVFTTYQYGDAQVTVQSLPGPPGGAEPGWEERFDVEVVSRGGEMLFWAGGGPSDHNPVSAPVTYDGPGLYRVRIYAQGRVHNTGVTSPDEEVLERFLIQVWKA